jgi:hypothetical protein
LEKKARLGREPANQWEVALKAALIRADSFNFYLSLSLAIFSLLAMLWYALFSY